MRAMPRRISPHAATTWSERVASIELVAAVSLLVLARVAPTATHTAADVAADALMLVGIWATTRYPRLALIAVVGAFVFWSIAPDTYPSPMVLGAYLVVLIWVRHARRGAIVVAVAMLTAVLALMSVKGGGVPVEYLALVVLMAVVWAIGTALRRLGTQVFTAREQGAESVRRLRMSLAAELHDTVAQSQTLVVMRAEDALALPGVPEPVRAELRGIVRASRQAIQDLRSTLAILRDIDGDFADGVTLDVPAFDEALETAADLMREAGFTTTVHADVDIDEVERAIAQAATRILLELTSNVRWHGTPGHASIRVEQTAEALTIEVANERSTVQTKAGGGLGLVGVKERARLLGGTVTVDQTPQSWTVRASLPLSLAAS